MRAYAADGALIAAVPEISVDLSQTALLRGQLALSQLRLRHPSIRLLRDAHGALQFGVGNRSETGNNALAATTDAFAALLAAPGTETPGGQLQRIEIRMET